MPKLVKQEIKDWVITNYDENLTYQELADKCNSIFNTRFCNETIRGIIRRYQHINQCKIIKNRQKIQATKNVNKGRINMPIGTINLVKSSSKRYAYYRIKVEYPNKWRRYTNYLYEKYYNVKVDDSKETVVQIDNKIDNFEKDNLLLISARTASYYGSKYHHNGSDRDFKNKQLRKIAYLTLELEQKLKENEKYE